VATKYTEQLGRVKRYFARFKQINDGMVHDQSSDHYSDDVYAFFQNCYHLKDWIKNDAACSAWSDVENYINSNPDLRICADLCNGQKHLVLTRPRSPENPSFAGENITLKIADGFGVKESIDISMKFKIATTSGDMDAFQLAERCVAAWEQYIRANVGTP